MRLPFIPQVRASALQNYLNVARFVGLDPFRMLQASKISPRDLENLDNRIAASAVVKLYEDSAAASGREDFGLLMAECRSFASLGPLGLLLHHEPSMRAILEQVVARRRLVNDIVSIRIEESCGQARIRFDLLEGFASRQMVESAVGSAYRLHHEQMAGAWQPDRVHFRHPAPTHTATHRRVFHCPIVFHSDFDGIACSSASLDVANPWHDPGMAAHARRFIDLLSSRPPPESITEQARQAIFLLIGSGHATMEKVAENLAIHPRTLQRLLHQEGISFGKLLGEVRRELAVRYLSGPQQPVKEIAARLGYSSVSSFTRWFTEEFGKSPAAWRRAPPQEVIARVAAAGR